MDRQYFVLLDGEDPIIITIKDDANRPNNHDCEDVIEEWVLSNYGYKTYFNYWELNTCERYRIQ